ncbi:Transcription factor TFIIIB component B [Phlyctochytrium bullatum]|nr:Transcription factor TFIIIB component B [Phlyctochytrium bullatum]
MFVTSRVNKGGPAGLKPKLKPGGGKPAAPAPAPAAPKPVEAAPPAPTSPKPAATATAPTPTAPTPTAPTPAPAPDAAAKGKDPAPDPTPPSPQKRVSPIGFLHPSDGLQVRVVADAAEPAIGAGEGESEDVAEDEPGVVAEGEIISSKTGEPTRPPMPIHSPVTLQGAEGLLQLALADPNRGVVTTPAASPRKRNADEALLDLVTAAAAADDDEPIKVTSTEDLRKLSIRRLMSLKSKVLKDSSATIRRREEKRAARKRRAGGGGDDSASSSGTVTPTPEKAPTPEVEPARRGRALQLRVVNGEIQIDEASQVVSAQEAAEPVEMEVVDESASSEKVNSMSFRTKTFKPRRWAADETERFYEWFGTDFNMISLLFPGLSRRHIKLKFNYEERVDNARVNATLRNQVRPPAEVLEKLKANQTQRIEEQRRETITRDEIEEALQQAQASQDALAAMSSEGGVAGGGVAGGGGGEPVPPPPVTQPDEQPPAIEQEEEEEEEEHRPLPETQIAAIPVSIQRRPLAAAASRPSVMSVASSSVSKARPMSFKPKKK